MASNCNISPGSSPLASRPFSLGHPAHPKCTDWPAVPSQPPTPNVSGSGSDCLCFAPRAHHLLGPFQALEGSCGPASSVIHCPIFTRLHVGPTPFVFGGVGLGTTARPSACGAAGQSAPAPYPSLCQLASPGPTRPDMSAPSPAFARLRPKPSSGFAGDGGQVGSFHANQPRWQHSPGFRHAGHTTSLDGTFPKPKAALVTATATVTGAAAASTSAAAATADPLTPGCH
jgi:hypothetical protein